MKARVLVWLFVIATICGGFYQDTQRDYFVSFAHNTGFGNVVVYVEGGISSPMDIAKIKRSIQVSTGIDTLVIVSMQRLPM